MREVSVDRFVRATEPVVRAALDPAAVVGYEGSFTARETVDADDATVVTAGGGGLELRLRFEERAEGLYYTQEGSAGPFDHMETWLTVAAENEGTRVRARSTVSLGVPLPLVDRVAGWKRRGELRRLLDNLAADVE